MNVVQLQADKREIKGGSANKSLRKQDMVPGVIYGLDENIHFAATHKAVHKLIYTPNFELVQVEVDGQSYRCIVKDHQRHPVTDQIQHVDLLCLKDGHPVKVEIPIKFVGQSPGVKLGGNIVRKLRKVKVKTTPELLVSEFEVDISNLELGQSVRVRDIVAIDGIQIMNDGPIPLASVEIPRALKSAASKSDEGAAADDAAEAGEATAE